MKINVSTFPTKLVCSSAALLALTACGGGSGEDGFFTANEVGSVPNALEDGVVFAAKHASALDRDYSAETTSPGTVPFTLRKTAEGNLAMTVDGTEIIFTEADRSEFGYVDDTAPGYLSLSSADGDQENVLDPENTSYANVFSYYFDNTGEGGNYGYVVIGAETELADLEALSSELTYNGFMNIEFHQQTDYVRFAESAVRVRGNMELVANFDSGMISGNSELGDLMLRDGDTDEAPMDGQVFYTSTMIDGTSFGSTITADTDFYTSTGVGLVDVEYEGSFFGPNGEEAAGVLSGTSAGGYNVVGQFNAEYFD